ncbi:MAG: dethiobiotin synthase [Nitrosomonas sp.]|nr:dethiobiotin synthase [Nitrosomonas sp.]MDP1950184.1 dethiobiotin synthase [Nitrosomonas sp.]
MTTGFFITGTDTGVGKTRVSCALLHAFAAEGKAVVGMKPVAAGCEHGKWRDVELLVAASNVVAAREQINPYALIPPLAPQIAAKLANIEIEIEVIQQAYARLKKTAEVVIVEGVGGFLVPFNHQHDGADLAKLLGLPVILVVGIRLGCLNHALLTARAIRTSGCPLIGWVANSIDPLMMAQKENIQLLAQRLDCQLLGILPFEKNSDIQLIAKLLDITKLGAA